MSREGKSERPGDESLLVLEVGLFQGLGLELGCRKAVVVVGWAE